MANDVNKIKLLLLWDILCKHTDENHAINTDEIIELLAQKGISVSRKIVVSDIEALCNYGYEVLSYKKKYHYYYVVNRQLETAEVVLLADVIKSSKLPARQKNDLIEKLTDTLCLYQAESISKHLNLCIRFLFRIQGNNAYQRHRERGCIVCRFLKRIYKTTCLHR